MIHTPIADDPATELIGVGVGRCVGCARCGDGQHRRVWGSFVRCEGILTPLQTGTVDPVSRIRVT